MSHTHQNRDKLRARVRRIAGLVAAIEKSVDESAPCGDVLHLVAGVRGAIGGLMDELMEAHLHEHVAAPGLTPEERHAGAEELATLLRRYSK